MRRFLALLMLTTLPSFAAARDVGYAFECVTIETGRKSIISFLEDGVDKCVHFVETAAGAMWDNHEWLADRRNK